MSVHSLCCFVVPGQGRDAGLLPRIVHQLSGVCTAADPLADPADATPARNGGGDPNAQGEVRQQVSNPQGPEAQQPLLLQEEGEDLCV